MILQIYNNSSPRSTVQLLLSQLLDTRRFSIWIQPLRQVIKLFPVPMIVRFHVSKTTFIHKKTFPAMKHRLTNPESFTQNILWIQNFCSHFFFPSKNKTKRQKAKILNLLSTDLYTQQEKTEFISLSFPLLSLNLSLFSSIRLKTKEEKIKQKGFQGSEIKTGFK